MGGFWAALAKSVSGCCWCLLAVVLADCDMSRDVTVIILLVVSNIVAIILSLDSGFSMLRLRRSVRDEQLLDGRS